MRWRSWRTGLGVIALAGGMTACTGDPDVPDCSADSAEETCAVFGIVNQERIDADLPPYAWNTELAVAAQLHAQDMVDHGYFDHTSQDGRSFADRAEDAGYDAQPRGENIAAGQSSPEQVMDSWMNSSGHRANILAEGSNEIGVGLLDAHWVQVFGHRPMPM